MRKTSKIFQTLLSESVRIEVAGQSGEERINDFLSKFGMGPNYKPKEKKTVECPKCKSKNAYYREAHADTDMNCMELYCPDCKYSEEK